MSESVYGAMERVVGKGGLKRVVHESLEQAGLPLRPTEYSAIHLLGVVSVGFAAQAFSGRFLVSVLAVLAATVSPILWVRWRIASRHRRFEEQLPDTLSLIASSLRAGWGLQHAFTLVVEQSAEPIRGEFARATTEIRLGLSVEESLFSIADRVHSVDFRWTATAISVQREVGGNLAEVLDIVASTMRERSALRRHIAGLVAEGRLSAMILIALPFGLAIVLSLVNPEYMRELVTTTPGVVMLVSGVILLIGGAYWLRRSIAIEV